jgi:hypothetical protein
VVEDVRCRPCCSSRCPLPRSVSTRCSLSGVRVSSPAVRCPTVGRPVTWFRRPGPTCPAVWCRPSGGQPSGVRPSVLWRPSWVSPPWPWEHAGSAGPSRLEWVGSRVACHVPSGSSTARRPGRRRRCGGRGPTGREGAGREPGPVALGLRRRPRSAADRPGRPAWPEGGSSPAADLGQAAQLLSVVVVEPATPSRRARKGQRARRRGWARGPSAAQPGSELAGSAPTTL